MYLAAALGVVMLYRRLGRRSPPLTLHLEGNIASGKSTLAAALAATVQPEPVAEWLDLEGHNLLGLLGADRSSWAFPFQALAIATIGDRDRLSLLSGKTRILERSIASSLRVFAQDAVNLGFLRPAHMAVLRRLGAALQPPSRRVHYIYLRTPPGVAYTRAARRGRDEESLLPLNYFIRLHHLLDHWMLRDELDRVSVINGLLRPEAVVAEALRILDALTASDQ